MDEFVRFLRAHHKENGKYVIITTNKRDVILTFCIDICLYTSGIKSGVRFNKRSGKIIMDYINAHPMWFEGEYLLVKISELMKLK